MRRLSYPLGRILALSAALVLHGGVTAKSILGDSGSSTACDPTRQSCAPTTPIDLGPGTGTGTGGGQSCSPSAGGATQCGSGPASQGNSSGTQQGAGNPINLINGNKYQQEVDMPALPGVLGLEVVRHYNSQYSLPNVPTGIMGRGWKLSYETELFDTPLGLQIVQADGTRLIFQKSKADASHCTSSNPANGTVTVLDKPHGKEYVWRWPGNGQNGGRTLLFNGDGKLVQIAAPSGEFVTLLYSPKGWLLQVRDPQGRELHLNYLDAAAVRADKDGTQAFRGVQSIDSPVGRFIYSYGNRRPEPTQTGPAGLGSQASAPSEATDSGTPLTVANLTSVSIPTGHDLRQRNHADSNGSPGPSRTRTRITRLYHYEDPQFPTLLTGISVQGAGSDGVQINQRLATYGYNGRGKARLSSKTDGAERVTLDTSTPHRTILTNSLGHKTTYLHAQYAGEWRLFESRGAGCATCGPANMRYGYDKQGRLTEQTTLDAQGKPLHGVRTTLDAQSRTRKVERIAYARGKPGAPQQLVRYEYPSDQATEPSLIARPSVVAGQEHHIRIRYNAAGQVLETTESGFEPLQGEAITRTTRYGYQTINGNSVLASIDDPLPNGPQQSPTDSDITLLAWDPSGSRITTLTQPGGNASTISYAPATGWLTEVKNAQGFYTQFVRDATGRLSTTRSGGPGWAQARVQSWRYDAQGNATERGAGEDIAGQGGFVPQARQGFDALGRLQWHASALGVLLHNRYDTESRLVETGRYSNTMAQVQHYGFDDQGRLQAVYDQSGAGYRLGYDARGAVAHITDAMGRTARTGHIPGAQAPAGPGVEMRALHPRQWVDDFGRTVATLSPDSGTTTRVFDAADRLVGSTDAMGHRATYAYDEQGRILHQTITDASTQQDTETRWEYQGRHLAALHHPTQSERYTYDARGLRTAKIVTLKTDGGEYTSVTRYQFDEAGLLQSSSLPDGSQITYQKNGQGQVVAVQRERIQTRWLRWLVPAQTLAQDLQRDLVGLKRYTAGNGIEAEFQRDRAGALARVVYRQTRAPSQHTAAARNTPPLLLGRTTQEGIHRLLGITTAQAAEAAPTASTPHTTGNPGALDLPTDPLALIDHRYLWDAQGNLLHQQNKGQQSRAVQSYAYDRHQRLVASATEQEANRYHYDRHGRRVLSQQGITDQADTTSHTVRTRFEPGTHRWISASGPTAAQNSTARYNSNGQPTVIGDHAYAWDALGRLAEVRRTNGGPESTAHETTNVVARYTYNHRGERIGKTAARQTTHYLYENQQLSAELNAQGQLTRQYLYMAGQPMAIIDTPEGQPLSHPDASPLALIAQDAKTILRIWLQQAAQPVWLHTNHLGAPEAATDASANLVWQARYAPFGKAEVTSHGPFTLHLRLPGQYEDQETGLHYNRHRYYDPARGQYLSADPLGTPDGPNGYAYVRYNPLKYVDPDGLILFAFDGTGNDERDSRTLSNVVKFRKLYQSDSAKWFYITGPGTLDPITGIAPAALDLGGIGDIAAAYTGKDRIAAMIENLNKYASSIDDENLIDIDTIGFSRGAAQARDFANQILALSKKDSLGNYWYGYKSIIDGVEVAQCQALNLRFMGLWDTVLSTHAGSYALAVPDAFKYVASAVALNEYRGAAIKFPLESIQGKAAPAGMVRIERGFLGSHSDIGGGYPEGDIAKVALVWMVKQAVSAGVEMMPLSNEERTIIGSPVIHDKSSSLMAENGPAPSANSEDRQVRYTDGSTAAQRNATNLGLTFPQTQQWITYKANPNSTDLISGTVDMNAYAQWLSQNYEISMKVEMQ
ncbi:MAG: hypothetical protein EOO32_02360 [Comamonadaceae bacterium]|nr:MAG: hypothetical protein EOO32_02360 [Comamonadaceae bacterium]